uniref:Uncharacterized protein n=1 Tax=Arundo donax TaxID=35708 RepID=A0A0A9H7E3_ARUDO
MDFSLLKKMQTCWRPQESKWLEAPFRTLLDQVDYPCANNYLSIIATLTVL